MSRKTLYRIVAVLFIVFAAGHTTGVLGSKDLPKAALDMRAAMAAAHFDFMGTDSTYAGFLEGFGLVVTLFLLFSAYVAWVLAGMKGEGARAARPIAWGLLAAILINAALAQRYFFAGPVALSILIAIGIVAAETRAAD